MRRIVSITHISLDGVIQAIGGPEEDPTSDFRYGGWTTPYGDEKGAEFLGEIMDRKFDLLLGRKTYDIWASFWPNQPDGFISTPFNNATKYVASRSPQALAWERSVQVDDIEDIRKLKETDGPELHVWGSSDLAHSLLETDLIDQMILITYPVVLGPGKRFFDGNSLASSFTVAQKWSTNTGVNIFAYERAGEVKTS